MSKKRLGRVRTKLIDKINAQAAKEQSKVGVLSVFEDHARRVFDKILTTLPYAVVAEIHMYEHAFDRLDYYLTLHGTQILRTNEVVNFTGAYVQPESKYRDIAVFKTYDHTKSVFLYKNALIALWNNRMHYIRGTVDVTELLDAAAACRMDKSETANRYTVMYSQGTGSGRAKRVAVATEAKSTDTPCVEDSEESVSTDMSARPVKWRREQLVAPIPENPFDTVAVCDNFNILRKEAKTWKDNGSWYKTRSVPWRYSAFVYGPPGSGKSTSIRALAQELGIPVLILDLTSLDNESLRNYWIHARSSAPCMVLFEDIDRLFNDDKELDPDKTDVTLDALLNVMSGIEPSDGIICLMTANSLKNIDPALLRPGRTDVQIEVGYLNQDGVRKISQRILAGYHAEIEAMVTLCCETPHTGAEVERLAQTRAVQLFWENARN